MEGVTTNAWSRSAIAPAVKRHERTAPDRLSRVMI
nr:MAG TPA: hypothetical protein [Caudoviricetes sp.]